MKIITTLKSLCLLYPLMHMNAIEYNASEMKYAAKLTSKWEMIVNKSTVLYAGYDFGEYGIDTVEINGYEYNTSKIGDYKIISYTYIPIIGIISNDPHIDKIFSIKQKAIIFFLCLLSYYTSRNIFNKEVSNEI